MLRKTRNPVMGKNKNEKRAKFFTKLTDFAPILLEIFIDIITSVKKQLARATVR